MNPAPRAPHPHVDVGPPQTPPSLHAARCAMFACGSMAAACAGSACMTATCGCLGHVGDAVAKTSARALYVVMFAVSTALAFVMRDCAQPLLKRIPWIARLATMNYVPGDEWFGAQARTSRAGARTTNHDLLRSSSSRTFFFRFFPRLSTPTDAAFQPTPTAPAGGVPNLPRELHLLRRDGVRARRREATLGCVHANVYYPPLGFNRFEHRTQFDRVGPFQLTDALFVLYLPRNRPHQTRATSTCITAPGSSNSPRGRCATSSRSSRRTASWARTRGSRASRPACFSSCR